MDGQKKDEERNGQLMALRGDGGELEAPRGATQEDTPLARLDIDEECPAEKKLTWRDTIPQLYVSLCAHSIVIHAGINMAFSSILLPELSKENSEIPVNSDEASWIASSVTLSTPVGALLAGPLMDRWGRRATARIACIPLALAWTTMALARSVVTLCLARVLAGIGGGLTTVALVYVSECAHPRLRPALLCLNSVAVSLGVLAAYAASAVLPSWRWVAWSSLGLAIISLAALTTPPESPHWLMLFRSLHTIEPVGGPEGDLSEGGGRASDAVKVLRRLNPSEAHFAEALRRLRLQAAERGAALKGGGGGSWGLVQILTRRASRRPLLLLLLLLLLQQLSGTYVIVFYAVDVLRGLAGKATGDEANEAIALILLGSIRLIASVVAAVLSRRIGRKSLCAVSGIGMCIASLSSGVLDTSGGSTELSSPSGSSTWIASAFVLVHVCTSALGVMVIPWTLIGELLPAEARGLGGGLSVCIAYAFMFGAVKGFPEAQNAIGGTKSLFLFFSASSFVGVVFLLLCIPETLGRSLHEIENHFSGKLSPKSRWWLGWNAWSDVKYKNDGVNNINR
ncbi:facilitated trehalose transporter Tret1-like [Ischnura elegans]|uniref:facilitated trehalose transporter Tret1-like n=1 Tax=Ischnura elegans TaxID=197161 RepID=UPI001ED88C9D|nr:facilitated trehalose transporter Tret1-like [Ischnura elegans]